jgi:hypothetical protein
MASTIDDAEFVLIDTFPGIAIAGAMPSDLTVTSTTEDFSIGTKRAVYNDTHKAWSTLMFAKLIGGTEGAASGMAVKSILGIDTVNQAAGAAGWAVTLTPDGGECNLNGSIAIALGTGVFATAATILYGWVQVGGPPLVDEVVGLDGTYVTDGNVAAESAMVIADNSGPCAFGIKIGTTVGLTSAYSGVTDV